MLAYVFAHRPGENVDSKTYERALVRFHDALAKEPPNGFVGSSSYRVAGGYSDWYLVDSSAALDGLNAAAVSAARAPVHDMVAAMAVDGVGKLLTLVSGEQPWGPGYEVRFAKPAGMSYPDLYRRLETWTGERGVSLWRRMMVLGPPPEFCVVAPQMLEMPAEMRPEVLLREPV